MSTQFKKVKKKTRKKGKERVKDPMQKKKMQKLYQCMCKNKWDVFRRINSLSFIYSRHMKEKTRQRNLKKKKRQKKSKERNQKKEKRRAEDPMKNVKSRCCMPYVQK